MNEEETIMKINYNHLVIRNATSKDAEILCRWWNDGEIMAHAGFPNGLGTNEETIIEQLARDTDDTYRRLILEADGLPIGEMNYRNKGDETAEIGIKICDFSKQNKGYGKMFLSMLIDSLFGNGYEKIILDTNVKNKRAQYVYEKIGFKKVRVNENFWTDQLGEKQLLIDYELEKADFVNVI